MHIDDFPKIEDGPSVVTEPELVYSAGDFDVYLTELEMLWRYDLFKDGEHIYYAGAISKSSAERSAIMKVKLLSNNSNILNMHNESGNYDD